jgi:hypothetical protein
MHRIIWAIGILSCIAFCSASPSHADQEAKTNRQSASGGKLHRQLADDPPPLYSCDWVGPGGRAVSMSVAGALT